MSNVKKKKYLTPIDIANEYEVSRSAVLKWLNDRELRGIKVGGRWKVQESDVFRFIEESTGAPKRNF